MEEIRPSDMCVNFLQSLCSEFRVRYTGLDRYQGCTPYPSLEGIDECYEDYENFIRLTTF